RMQTHALVRCASSSISVGVRRSFVSILPVSEVFPTRRASRRPHEPYIRYHRNNPFFCPNRNYRYISSIPIIPPPDTNIQVEVCRRERRLRSSVGQTESERTTPAPALRWRLNGGSYASIANQASGRINITDRSNASHGGT